MPAALWDRGQGCPALGLAVEHEGCCSTWKVVLRVHWDVVEPCGGSWPRYGSQALSLEYGLVQLRSQACMGGVGRLASAPRKDCECPAQPLAVGVDLNPAARHKRT